MVPVRVCMQVVLDQPEAFNAMVYLLSAGCDHKFWQVLPCSCWHWGTMSVPAINTPRRPAPADCCC